MRSFRKDAKIGGLVLVAAIVIAQAIRIEKTNPPAHGELSLDPAVKPVVERACYDCHSNKTVWPWYSNVAPASWLIESDVNEGRRKLNFSEWGKYSGSVQAHKLEEIVEELQNGAMPPWYYSIMHRGSRVGSEERDQIRAWMESMAEAK